MFCRKIEKNQSTRDGDGFSGLDGKLRNNKKKRKTTIYLCNIDTQGMTTGQQGMIATGRQKKKSNNQTNVRWKTKKLQKDAKTFLKSTKDSPDEWNTKKTRNDAQITRNNPGRQGTPRMTRNDPRNVPGWQGMEERLASPEKLWKSR